MSVSETAQEYISSQLSLEADAREALPYQFDSCTFPLGALRQSVYACLTCTPPPASKHQHFTPAGVCYSCSISCHGEHTLVELFSKRDFACDCGTTRMSNGGTPCSLRAKEDETKGGVSVAEPRHGNRYNQNYQGRFCGCREEYDPEKEKGTMFQCLGLGHIEDGGCDEDWWHPECLMGFPREKHANGALAKAETLERPAQRGGIATSQPAQPSSTEPIADAGAAEDDLPPGFPREDDFEYLICYKCADAYPWIKQYAGTAGFLPAVPVSSQQAGLENHENGTKRKAEDDVHEEDSKKVKTTNTCSSDDVVKRAESNPSSEVVAPVATAPRHASLPLRTSQRVSLFLQEDFREHLCRCSECFPRLAKHSQLLEEEDPYEPPLSESDGPQGNGSIAGRSVASGSLLDRGEAALSSMDRVRAIEGVMAYNHVRDKVKAFLQPFAQSGEAVGAEDIKAYFAKLRGDEQAMREAQDGASVQESTGQNGHRRKQDGS